MSEGGEEREPLIHSNTNWGSTSRRQVIGESGEYNVIVPHSPPPPPGIHLNHDFIRSETTTCGTPHESILNNRSNKQERGKSSLGCNRSLYGASGTILICVTLERVAFYGLVGNLVLFLNKYPFFWESYHAMTAVFLFMGISYFMALLGGWLADAFLGRFKTLLISFAIYICGMIMMPFLSSTSGTGPVNKSMHLPQICGVSDGDNATDWNKDGGPFGEKCAWLIYITLMIIAIGCGALKANVCPFGSDQLVGQSPSVQFSFFNWYYWCVNFGTILSFGAVAYIEQEKGFQLGYIICTVTLGCSVLVFISGRCFYKIRPPDGSILTNIFRIIRNAWRVKRLRKKERRLNERIAEIPNMHEVATSQNDISFLDHAKHRYGGIFHKSLVEDVKKLKVILAVFSVSILYWLVYFQMQTTFVFQGLHMRLSQGTPEDVYPSNRSSGTDPSRHSGKSHSFVVVVVWFSLFDAAAVIILLPLFDRVIYPYLERRGHPITFAKRIVLGMLFALLAMVVAGVVEHQRLKKLWPYPDKPCVSSEINQVIGHSVYDAADMSVFWQIPQYFLLGTSEVFASVATLQFAVSVAPNSMKALITGLYYLFMGIGSFLGTAIIATLSSSKIWFYDENYGNINCRLPCAPGKPLDDVQHSCHLDYYFYLLAGLELVAIFLFCWIAYVFGLNSEEVFLSLRDGARPPASTTASDAAHRRGVRGRGSRRNTHVQQNARARGGRGGAGSSSDSGLA